MDGAQAIQLPVAVPLWVDLLAVFIAGIGGSLIAIRKGFDPAGVVALTLASAMGGGIIRDVLIGHGTPAALANADYLYTASVAAIVGLLFRRFVGRAIQLFVPIDAASLGLFTFVGMQKGLNFSLPVITAALLGVITATGGGLLRDVLSGEAPSVLRPGHLSMSAAIVGAAVYAVLYWMGVPGYVVVWIIVAVVMGLRLASEYFGWATPEASAVPGNVTAMGSAVLAAPQRLIPRGSGPSRSAAPKLPRPAWLRRQAEHRVVEPPVAPPGDAPSIESQPRPPNEDGRT